MKKQIKVKLQGREHEFPQFHRIATVDFEAVSQRLATLDVREVVKNAIENLPGIVTEITYRAQIFLNAETLELDCYIDCNPFHERLLLPIYSVSTANLADYHYEALFGDDDPAEHGLEGHLQHLASIERHYEGDDLQERLIDAIVFAMDYELNLHEAYAKLQEIENRA